LKGFKYHIDKEHNPWNYLFLIYNLRYKKKTNLRGLEVYISKCMSETVWIPIGRSWSVVEVDHHLDIENKLDKIQKNAKTFLARVNKKIQKPTA
jgi:hypothetical protein